jgi:type II secretory pathway pseudopilin PulG
MQRRTPSPGSHGFTLVELMVALSGGLFLSIMVFALSRDTSRFYQRENRLAGAVMAGMTGFERLKADIARAGYLASPNIATDPLVGTRPTAGWPAQLQNMTSLRITPNTPTANTSNPALVGAALTPDEITLAGSYAVTDRFPVASAVGNVITLAPNMGAMARIGYLTPGLTVADQTALLAQIFRPGRVLRATDNSGLAHFGVIANVNGGATPTITLAGAPVVQLDGNGTGSSVNVINFVRYQIRDLKADGLTRFQPVFNQSLGAPGEATRTELVRQELDAAGTDLETLGANTTELVAEYAIDLSFSVTAWLQASNQLLDMQPGTANFDAIFNTNLLIAAPQRVRAVRVRLSVRSREADRDVGLPNGLYRFKLPDGAWARVRTFQADIALPNQLDVRW